MTLELTGRKIAITPALRTFTEQKIKKLDKILDGILEAHVILSVEKRRHSAEIVVHSRNATLSGSDTSDDLYASIGQVLAKLEHQAKRHKAKYKWSKGKNHGRGLATIRTTPPMDDGEMQGGDNSPRLIRTRRYAVKPMTVDEAMLQVQGTNDTFLVFRDAQSQRVSVLYRRSDGNFGLIEPDR